MKEPHTPKAKSSSPFVFKSANGGGVAGAARKPVQNEDLLTVPQRRQDTEAFQGRAGTKELPEGRVLYERYRVLKKINSGGFGITYLAEELTGAKIVLKEYFPPLFASRDAHTSTVVPLPGCENDYFRYLELFEREAKQLASMHHPSIVSLSAAFQENNTAYYAMPYIGGGSLSQAVKAMRAGKVYLSQIAVLHILRSLLNALDHMHSRKLHGKPIYHLDIKPGNVLLTDEGNKSVPVFIDLGSENMGTPGFMPYEQCLNNGSGICPATDLFALGATMYMLLTGRKPNPHVDRDNRISSEPVQQPRLTEDETLRKRYDEELLAGIDRALAWDPADRFSSAREWLSALEDVSIRFSDQGISVSQMVHLSNSSLPHQTETVPPGRAPSAAKNGVVRKENRRQDSGDSRRKGAHPVAVFGCVLVILLGILLPFLMMNSQEDSEGTPPAQNMAQGAPVMNCTAGADDAYYAVKGNKHYQALKNCGCNTCASHVRELDNLCYVAQGAREKAAYNDDAYQVMSLCVKENDCADCKRKVAALDEDFKRCRVDDAARSRAKYNDSTYRAMQQCVRERGCSKCREQLGRMCSVPKADKHFAVHGDSTYDAMVKCSREKDCKDCSQHVRRLDAAAQRRQENKPRDSRMLTNEKAAEYARRHAVNAESNDLSYVYSYYSNPVYLDSFGRSFSLSELESSLRGYVGKWTNRTFSVVDAAYRDNYLEVRFRYNHYTAAGKNSNGYCKCSLKFDENGKVTWFRDDSNRNYMPEFSPGLTRVRF